MTVSLFLFRRGMMKKKSQQIPRHKPPNIFNLVTKVFLALLMIVTTTYTGITGSSGIDFAKPASASNIKTLVFSKQPNDWSSYFQGNYESMPSKVTMTVDLSNNNYTNSGTYQAYHQWLGGTSYVSTTNAGIFGGTLTPEQVQVLNELKPTTEHQLLGSSGPNQYWNSSAKYKLDTVSTSSSGGSCGGSNNVKTLVFAKQPNDWTSYFQGNHETMPNTVTMTIDSSNNKYTNSATYQAYHQYLGGTSYVSSSNAGIFGGTLTPEQAQVLNELQPTTEHQLLGATGPNQYWSSSAKYKISTVSTGSSGGSCGGSTPSPTPSPTPTTVYPKTCASGLTPKGTPGTSSFYCEKPVKQTEIKNPDFIKDINLGDIIAGMGDYGSTGDRGDGQFNLDSGNHNNGWYLNGNGDAYKSDHIQFTNVPDNGYVNALGDSWSPEYLITQGKNKVDVPVPTDSTTVEKQKRDTSLSNFKTTGSLSEVITYKVTDLEVLKTIQGSDKGLIDLFTKTGSTYKYGADIVSHKVDETGEGNYGEFKVNQSGYYILGTKYIDKVGAKKESTNPSQDVIDKYTYYSFVPVSVNFMSDLGYLPVYNNLLTQINDSLLTIGNKKANHKLSNLEYQTFKSMKVPSAYNYTNNKTLIGSTSGGLQLLSKELSPITVADNASTMDTAKVTDIVEYGTGFYVATDKGILYLNCEDNTLNETTVTEPVNDLEINYDSLYYLTDSKLSMLFADGSSLIKSTNEYDLSTMFNDPATKAGRVEILNGLLTVSSKDDSSLSEVITLTK